MTTLKRALEIVAVTLAFYSLGSVCRADDLQSLMHKLVNQYGVVSHFGAEFPAGKEWAADKEALSAYGKEQVVAAIIAEIDIDRGSGREAWKNNARDINAREIFHALYLPPTLVCQELDKPQLPQRKASLMRLLWDLPSPEATQALLRQLNDRRPAGEPPKMEFGHPAASRVCDIAANTLAKNLNYKRSSPVAVYLSVARRDEIIQEVLADLKLTKPE